MIGVRTAVILSTVVALCAAKCCMPAQWEGKEAETGGVVVGQKAERSSDFMDISFDLTNQKVSVISNQTVGGKQTATWIIEHGKDNVMYIIDLMAKTCTKGTIQTPIVAACVPDTAKPGNMIVYGGGERTLECQTYTWKQTGSGFDLDFFVAVVQDGSLCYPVAEEVVGVANGMPQIETYGFVDITNGIKDPSIFNPPSYCNQVPLSNVEKVKKGHSFLGF